MIFYLFNEPVVLSQRENTPAYGVIVDPLPGCTQNMFVNILLTRQYCYNEWNNPKSEYTLCWCEQNGAKLLDCDIDITTPSGEIVPIENPKYSFLSENGKVYKTLIGEYPPEEFIRTFFPINHTDLSVVVYAGHVVPFDCFEIVDGNLWLIDKNKYNELINRIDKPRWIPITNEYMREIPIAVEIEEQED